MNELNAVPLRTVKSFVVRTGRMTEAQKAAMAAQWPRYGLEVAGGPESVRRSAAHIRGILEASPSA